MPPRREEIFLALLFSFDDLDPGPEFSKTWSSPRFPSHYYHLVCGEDYLLVHFEEWGVCWNVPQGTAMSPTNDPMDSPPRIGVAVTCISPWLFARDFALLLTSHHSMSDFE